ncbi:unnamed protein product, partial [marine sediment metagenome]
MTIFKFTFLFPPKIQLEIVYLLLEDAKYVVFSDFFKKNQIIFKKKEGFS